MPPARTNIQRHLQAALLLTSSLLLMTCPAGGQMCMYDFSGPVDAVFVIDRSATIGLTGLGDVKALVRSIVLKKIPTGPTADANSSRLAVVTVTGSATVDLDLIADPREIYNCELFAPGGLFERHVSSTVEPDGGNNGMRAAIQTASDLFNERPEVRKKVLFLSSDFHDIEAPTIRGDLSQLSTAIARTNGILMTYGIGVGTYYDVDNMQEIFDHDPCSALRLDDWKPYVAGDGPSGGMPHPITDPALCCHLCANSTACSCHEHDDLAGGILTPQCVPRDYMCPVMTSTTPTTPRAGTPSTTTGAGTPSTTTGAGVETAGDAPVTGVLLGVSVMAALLMVAVIVLAVGLVRRTMAAKKKESAMRMPPTATNAAWWSGTNQVALPASPYEILEIASQARLEGEGSATYCELTEAAEYMNMAAGRSREQSGSEPEGPERSEAGSYVDMAAGRSREQSGSEPTEPVHYKEPSYLELI